MNGATVSGNPGARLVAFLVVATIFLEGSKPVIVVAVVGVVAETSVEGSIAIVFVRAVGLDVEAGISVEVLIVVVAVAAALVPGACIVRFAAGASEAFLRTA